MLVRWKYRYKYEDFMLDYVIVECSLAFCTMQKHLVLGSILIVLFKDEESTAWCTVLVSWTTVEKERKSAALNVDATVLYIE